jgi:hypothetical protein
MVEPGTAHVPVTGTLSPGLNGPPGEVSVKLAGISTATVLLASIPPAASVSVACIEKSAELIVTLTALQSMTPLAEHTHAAGLVIIEEAGVAATLTLLPAGEHVPILAGSVCGTEEGTKVVGPVSTTVGGVTANACVEGPAVSPSKSVIVADTLAEPAACASTSVAAPQSPAPTEKVPADEHKQDKGDAPDGTVSSCGGSGIVTVDPGTAHVPAIATLSPGSNGPPRGSSATLGRTSATASSLNVLPSGPVIVALKSKSSEFTTTVTALQSTVFAGLQIQLTESGVIDVTGAAEMVMGLPGKLHSPIFAGSVCGVDEGAKVMLFKKTPALAPEKSDFLIRFCPQDIIVISKKKRLTFKNLPNILISLT